ncbi:restriction endonuclease subunit S [Acinetobacter oleivorans]|uniref:restriction endonuclease subunit S n=1 Tax=Acinetobacter oleivorans TaxID=1148157 RepID=UPI00157FDD09|nr:restriction endonuclease subunit S [Acinetobacter oleivorans]NUF31731.1 restriction endonuclease subunit S [Acinetobacter oleivorans]
MSVDLPLSWEKTILENVSVIFTGKTPPTNDPLNYGGETPFIKPPHLINEKIYHSTETLSNKGLSYTPNLPKDTVLVSCIGNLGKVGITAVPVATNQQINAVIFKKNIVYPQYGFYYCQTLENWLNKQASATTIPIVNKSKFSQAPFILPPYNEQIRIADKIDELFSELNNGIAELETAQKKLELYRQSLLKSAVDGELSKEWRKTQTKFYNTGEQLLEHILKERHERWEQEKLNEFKEKGVNPPKNWQEKYLEPVEPDTANLPTLPEGWVWATIDQLTIEQRYGTSAKTNDDQNGIPVLRMGNIQNGAIDFNNLKYLPKNHGEFPSLLLEKGDLLFNRTNSRELVGKTAIYNGEYIPCSYASYLIKVKFHSDFNSNLAAYYINSVFGKGWINEVAVQQTGQANVNGTKLSQLCIPVMSQAEQSYIVEKAKELKNACESSFIQIGNNIKLLTMQKQNILKDAFTGVLVDQDPNDEPAQVLLERIKQQQKAEALTKKNTPKKLSSPKVKKEIGMSQTILEILQQQSNWISGQALATAFGLNINSSIGDIEHFYEQLRTLSLDDKIMVKPDQQNNKEQDLIKLKDKTDAS